MENIISEIKVIETDDGYRIEINGDKEQIKSLFSTWMAQDPTHYRGFRPGPWGCRHPWHHRHHTSKQNFEADQA